MARIELITRGSSLSPDGEIVAGRIVETRGELSRPFQVLLHSPAFADRVAELGHLVRSGSSLADADRELATLATGSSLGCDFVWTSHLDTASAAGVAADAIEALRDDPSRLDGREATIVAFVDELCRSGTVSGDVFAAARETFETRALVELAATVGYYTMLARVMGAFEAC
jgi:4-carboxymuconolactone decarboxylase